jgi:hypothetical protein
MLSSAACLAVMLSCRYGQEAEAPEGMTVSISMLSALNSFMGATVLVLRILCPAHHHHHVTQSSHSINAIGPAPLCPAVMSCRYGQEAEVISSVSC